MPAARYVQARQYASIFRGSSLDSRSTVIPVFVSSTVGFTSVITCVMNAPPLHAPRPPCSRSPCDHAFPMHHCKPRDQAVGVVVAANPEELVQPPETHGSAGEGQEPAVVHHEGTILIISRRQSSPTHFLTKPEKYLFKDRKNAE